MIQRTAALIKECIKSSLGLLSDSFRRSLREAALNLIGKNAF